ncbi:MAG: peptidylprolyl isomerase [Proteobacteria bacterium]|nr:peptidylprolyl isomerase [Pseudomonadota bacterium]
MGAQLKKDVDLSQVLAYRNKDVVDSFCESFDISREDAEDIFQQMLKFFWLSETQDKEIMSVIDHPISIVDEMWHTFVLFTKQYRKFCFDYFGRFIHHNPTTVDEKREPLDEEKIKAAKAKIEKIKKELEDPKADFGAMAEKHSDCPSGKRNKGALGAFPRHGAMVEPFAKAAFELEPGQISDVVETQFGYHLVKVTEKKEEKVTSFDEVKDDIENQLVRTKKSSVLSEYVKDLRAKAVISYLNKDDDPKEIKKKQLEQSKKAEAEKEEK